MSKVLVVLYSLTGTSRNVAQLLCSQQGWEMAEIREASPRTAGGALGVVRCIVDSLLRLRPAIRYIGPPPAGFDAVVLISPIWALQLAGPMRSFVAMHRDKLPAVAVISIMGGSGAPNAVAEIARMADRAPILSTEFTAREVGDGSFAARLQAFGTSVGSAITSQEAVRPTTLSPQSV
ncbi:flavodoxin [Variovorax sp. J22R133]|uniref:flavodoxin family protein n=1 Tax=Variovorax brevis TaxID=3053503 RepID=UPI0025780800|nr:flavodoxin [Variovorax sp. J22R133]MDM0116343.1 flavodoxin [Variovorax sp. J22R133]